MERYEPALTMNIKDRDPGDSMDGDVPYKDALDFDVPTLVRETGQNILDANGIMDGTAKVTYRFLRLEGGELEEFKDAVDWDAYEAHLERFRDEDTSLRIADFLDVLHEREQLDVLVVEDQNTHGLYGGEIEDGTPYNALVRDSKITVKDDDTSGGSHGVGKSILYGLSLSSSVLFYSRLAPELLSTPGVEVDEEQVGQSLRLVGRGLLPDYRRDDTRILDGEEIWFGVYDESEGTDRPVSVWGSEAEEVAERLGIARPDVPGTTTAIVGFGKPDGDVPPDLDTTAETLKHAVAYHFWPAIEMGHLEVDVVSPNGRTESVLIDAAMRDYAQEIGPFVKIFRQYQDADDELTEPGDVAKTSIDFEFQPKGEDPIDGTAALGVRVPTAADLEHQGVLNHVALFRGRGMIVDYISKGSLASRGRDFHAILAAGKARTWPSDSSTSVDEEVDKFLRAAEPAEHDEWDNQSKLQQNYKGRCAGTVRDIKGDYLKEALLPLIRTGDDMEGETVPSLSALFDLGIEGMGGTDGDRSLIEREIHSRNFDPTDRRWVYKATISPKPDVHGAWEARVSIRPKGEDNNKAGDISVAEIEPIDVHPDVTLDKETKERQNGERVTVGLVEAPGHVHAVEVRVISAELPSVDPRLGDIGTITLGATGDVDLDDVEAVADGGE